MKNITSVSIALTAALVGGCQSMDTEQATSEVRLSGAIFTTLVDGARVDANIYDRKEDVYLDGGPGEKAPANAAGLPAGDYYFQVTDPSGKVLLSSDDIEARRISLDDNGLITRAYGHATGIDVDHGAVTVQLFPYDDTPNNGGEYKAWITPVDEYVPGEGKNGFIPRYSKTDNFKVRRIAAPPPPAPYCGDGNVDEGEACDDGNTTNGDGCENDCSLTPPPPPPPHSCCGDGTVDEGEQCDDGNTTDGDGCSATCTEELPPPPPPCDEHTP